MEVRNSFLFDRAKGPSKYHQALLQILHHLLTATIESCLELLTFRNKIPQWFTIVTRFIHGPLASEALQVINACMKQTEPTIQIEITAPSAQPSHKEVFLLAFILIQVWKQDRIFGRVAMSRQSPRDVQIQRERKSYQP